MFNDWFLGVRLKTPLKKPEAQLNMSEAEELKRFCSYFLSITWALFVWLPQVSASAAAAASASMKTVVVRFADAAAAADAAAYYIATAGFIGVSRRTQRSDAASNAASCVNKTNKNWRRMLTLPLPPVPMTTKRTALQYFWDRFYVYVDHTANQQISVNYRT